MSYIYPIRKKLLKLLKIKI